MQLHIEDRNADSGSIPVRWTVPRETLEKLAEAGAKQVFVLLIVVPEDGYAPRCTFEWRGTYPLQDFTAYVPFMRPGKNYIHAVLLGADEAWPDTRALDKPLARNIGFWKTTYLTADGVTVHAMDQELWASVEVEVPESVFAQKPADWLWNWGNFSWRNPPVDTCDFRRRLIWAFSGQLAIASAVYAFRLIAVILLLLCGMRGVNAAPLRDPLACSTQDIWENLKGSVFTLWPTEKGWKRHLRLVLLPFAPAFWLPVLISMAIVGVSNAVTTTLLIALGACAAIFTAAQILNLLNLVTYNLMMQARRADVPKKKPSFLRQRAVRRLAPMTAVATSSNAEPADTVSSTAGAVQVLPSLTRRPIRLHVSAVIGAVCAPFAR